MHFVIIKTLIVITYGSKVAEGYYPVPHNDRYERRYVPMPQSEIRQDNQYRQIALNNHEHNGHAAISDVLNMGQEQTDDDTKIMSINLAFERHINQNRHGNINLPRQSFSIDAQYPNIDFDYNQRNGNQQNRHTDFSNYESVPRNNNAHNEEYDNEYNRRGSSLNRGEIYSSRRNIGDNSDFNRQGSPIRGGVTNTPRSFGTNYKGTHDASTNDRQRSNKPNYDQPTRQQHEMVFDSNGESSKRKTLDERNSSVTNTNLPMKGVISFMNKDNNSNADDMRYDISNKNIDVSDSPNKVNSMDEIPSKTTIENEVTPDPFQDDSMRKKHRTTDDERWVWGDDDKLTTVTTNTPPTLDDRAAFAGDKCATGMARVAGKCVQTDK